MSGGKEVPRVPAQCVGCEGLTETLSQAELNAYSGVLCDWSIVEDGTKLSKVIRPKSFSVSFAGSSALTDLVCPHLFLRLALT